MICVCSRTSFVLVWSATRFHILRLFVAQAIPSSVSNCTSAEPARPVCSGCLDVHVELNVCCRTPLPGDIDWSQIKTINPAVLIFKK
jgi:hypothetical protein